MKSSVLVTAVSGTGKSTVCEALQAIGYNAIDIESIDGLYELVNEKTGEIIPGHLEQISEGVDWNCNKPRLEKLVESQTSELTFYCGGMSNTFDIWDVFDLVIMLARMRPQLNDCRHVRLASLEALKRIGIGC